MHLDRRTFYMGMFLKAVFVFINARQTIIDMSIVITIYANIFPSQTFAPTFSTS